MRPIMETQALGKRGKNRASLLRAAVSQPSGPGTPAWPGKSAWPTRPGLLPTCDNCAGHPPGPFLSAPGAPYFCRGRADVATPDVRRCGAWVSWRKEKACERQPDSTGKQGAAAVGNGGNGCPEPSPNGSFRRTATLANGS